MPKPTRLTKIVRKITSSGRDMRSDRLTDHPDALDDHRLDRHVLMRARRCVFGHGRDAVAHVHSAQHAAEHGVAEVFAARSRGDRVRAVVRDIEVELRRWRCAALSVRAMARVPRTLLSPLVASFWIGGRVGFSTMVGRESTALDHESSEPRGGRWSRDRSLRSTYCRKFVDRDRRPVLEQLHRDVAERGRNDDGGVARRRRAAARVAGRPRV